MSILDKQAVKNIVIAIDREYCNYSDQPLQIPTEQSKWELEVLIAQYHNSPNVSRRAETQAFELDKSPEQFKEYCERLVRRAKDVYTCKAYQLKFPKYDQMPSDYNQRFALVTRLLKEVEEEHGHIYAFVDSRGDTQHASAIDWCYANQVRPRKVWAIVKDCDLKFSEYNDKNNSMYNNIGAEAIFNHMIKPALVDLGVNGVKVRSLNNPVTNGPNGLYLTLACDDFGSECEAEIDTLVNLLKLKLKPVEETFKSLDTNIEPFYRALREEVKRTLHDVEAHIDLTNIFNKLRKDINNV